MDSERTCLILALAAILLVGCSDQGIKQMTTRPAAGTNQAGGGAERRVALFRVIIDVDGEPMDEPWTLHWSGLRVFTVVAPWGARLTSRQSFLPGRPNAAAADDGWGFVAVPPGAYQLVFEGMAIRFAMAGAQFVSSEAVSFGRSPPSIFNVPGDANLIYIGTFDFACHRPLDSRDDLKLECTSLEIRNEAPRARQIAQTSLEKYGPLQEVLALPPETKLVR